MRTQANCPTCEHPFSFLKVAFAIAPFRIFCNHCRSQIIIENFRKYLWVLLFGIAVITGILLNFANRYDMGRVFLLVVIWIALYEVLEVCIGLLVVNYGRFSKPR